MATYPQKLVSVIACHTEKHARANFPGSTLLQLGTKETHLASIHYVLIFKIEKKNQISHTCQLKVINRVETY